ncbi:MAG: hypothetical protein IPM52_11380 [Bacteroidetes bacterium]|nr:hypothetical protein [Bacteroidota bacterium]
MPSRPVLLVFVLWLAFVSCAKEERNPNIPNVYINILINPNSTQYQPLNTAGGWMYLTSDLPSRGIIVHRINQTEFVAFDRIPPNEPNKCCDGNNCTRLVVDGNYPFAKDNCTGTLYSLLDGSIFQGSGRWPMIRYNTAYDGAMLRIFN